MTDGWWRSVVPPDSDVPDIDTSVAHSARVYDYWLGGKDNFAVDREAARVVMDAYPGIVEGVRAQRAFLGNAVRYLAGPAGVRQFLDIGTGIPAANNTHEVAHAVDPACRVVYVDNDPMVLAHARALLAGAAGTTAFLDADLRDTGRILTETARLLDFAQPIALMLVGVLQLIPDEDDPHGIVRRLLAAVPSGSWLAVAHPTGDGHQRMASSVADRFNRLMAQPTTLRSHAEITRFFEGTQILAPGVVQLHRWRPGSLAPDPGTPMPAYCGLGRKP